MLLTVKQFVILGLSFFLFRALEMGDSLEKMELGLVLLIISSVFIMLVLPWMTKNSHYWKGVGSGIIVVVIFWGLTRYNMPMMMGYSYDIVDSGSNYPTLKDGDMVISKHFNYSVDVGSFVGFTDPSGTPLRKRVVAAQGDLVKTCDNLVTVNEEVFYRWKDTIDCQDFETISLKTNEFFVLGENLNNSLDSRTFGVISRDDIFAESLYKFTEGNREIRLN
jgi:signal peptidase I